MLCVYLQVVDMLEVTAERRPTEDSIRSEPVNLIKTTNMERRTTPNTMVSH